MQSSKVILSVMILIASSVVLDGCSQSPSPRIDPDATVIYSNSFESSRDTLGWHGDADIRLYPDALPMGGLQSLHISTPRENWEPHITKPLGILTTGGRLVLQFDAKMLDPSYGGTFILYADSTKEFPYTGAFPYGIGSYIGDTIWHSVVDTIPIGGGAFLRVQINGRNVLVDNIRIYRAQT